MLELDGKTYDALIKEVDYNPLAHTATRRLIFRHW